MTFVESHPNRNHMLPQGISERMAMLAAIIESSDDAIVSKNLNSIITSWNKAAENIFGYTEAEAVGQPITLIIPPDLRSEEEMIISKLKRGEKIDHFETIRIKKNGSRLHISLSVSPIRNEKGEIVGASKIAKWHHLDIALAVSMNLMEEAGLLNPGLKMITRSKPTIGINTGSVLSTMK